ncbi:MAG TPA: glycosyltransferase [Acidimicrobiales bacterium]|nr:glycosyltransferase [Acidimicrobiales bacterium]
MTRSAITGRLQRLATVSLIPSLVDVGLLVLLRQGLGWVLVVADLVAIAVASLLSYLLHRLVTFRSDPYVRWVHVPPAFVAVAGLAALVDVVVLRALFAGTGFSSVAGLVTAKAVALTAAAVVRLVGYRAVLLVGLTSARQQRSERPEAPGSLRFSVVVPAFEEAAGIRATVGSIRAALADVAAEGGLEVIVVDDGSSDGTADAALAADADQVVVLPVNRGKGAAVRAGVLAARGRTVAFTDADLSYSPDQLLRILDAVEGGWDVAIGDRGHPEARTVVRTSKLRQVGSRVINLFGYAVLLGSFRDTQCGLKGFRSDVGRFLFSRMRIDGFAFDIELLHLVERHELSLAQVPVAVSHSDRSTVRVVRDAVRLVRDLFRMRHWAATGAYEAGDASADGLAGSDDAERRDSDALA